MKTFCDKGMGKFNRHAAKLAVHQRIHDSWHHLLIPQNGEDSSVTTDMAKKVFDAIDGMAI